MGRRGHDRVVGVPSCALAGYRRCTTVRAASAWRMVVCRVSFRDLKCLSPNLGDIFCSLFFLSWEHSLEEISRVLLREFIHAFGVNLPKLKSFLLWFDDQFKFASFSFLFWHCFLGFWLFIHVDWISFWECCFQYDCRLKPYLRLGLAPIMRFGIML